MVEEGKWLTKNPVSQVGSHRGGGKGVYLNGAVLRAAARAATHLQNRGCQLLRLPALGEPTVALVAVSGALAGVTLAGPVALYVDIGIGVCA